MQNKDECKVGTWWLPSTVRAVGTGLTAFKNNPTSKSWEYLLDKNRCFLLLLISCLHRVQELQMCKQAVWWRLEIHVSAIFQITKLEYKFDFLQILSFSIREQPHMERRVCRAHCPPNRKISMYCIKFDLLFWINVSSFHSKQRKMGN